MSTVTRKSAHYPVTITVSTWKTICNKYERNTTDAFNSLQKLNDIDFTQNKANSRMHKEFVIQPKLNNRKENGTSMK